MRKKPDLTDLTRRERQIMDIIYRSGSATAAEVMDQLPDNPVNATVRTMLNVLEKKGFLRHESEMGRYVYYPTIPLRNFFSGAEASAIISILKKSEAKLSQEEREMIIDLIGKSKEKGR